MRGKTVNAVKHDRHCLAASAIAAVENFRDSDWTTYPEFITGLDTIRETAEGYLADGVMTCRCAINVDREGYGIIEWDADGAWVSVVGPTGMVDAHTQRERWTAKIAYVTSLISEGWSETMINIPAWVEIPDRVERHLIGNERHVSALDFLTFAYNVL